MRERLIKLMKQRTENKTWTIWGLADYILANGVIVPPCKVGDTVYVVSRYYSGMWQIHECRVASLTIYEKNIFMSLVDREYVFGMEVSEIDKTVFLTKEEAERALKGGK